MELLISAFIFFFLIGVIGFLKPTKKMKALSQIRMAATKEGFKIGDNVIVRTGDGKRYKGKIEKLKPLKIRTGPTDTVVFGRMSGEIDVVSDDSYAKGGDIKATSEYTYNELYAMPYSELEEYFKNFWGYDNDWEFKIIN